MVDPKIHGEPEMVNYFVIEGNEQEKFNSFVPGKGKN